MANKERPRKPATKLAGNLAAKQEAEGEFERQIKRGINMDIKRPDPEAFQLFMTKEHVSLKQWDQYKALTILANNGLTSPNESELSLPEQELLQLRRQLCHGEFQSILINANKKVYQDSLHEGDRLAILGMAYYRLDMNEQAIQAMSEAANCFQKIDEGHRWLRAKINVGIFRQNLESFRVGELFCLAQIARRMKALDLSGNIQKSKAIELLCNNLYLEAVEATRLAIDDYNQAGCPQDRAVAYAIQAIAYFCNGDFELAKSAYVNCDVRTGKVIDYCTLYEKMSAGKPFEISSEHPLFGLRMENKKIKLQSLSSKIIRLLGAKSMTRAELITELWQDSGDYDSLVNRLYVAIAKIRKQELAKIVFDGEKYKLA